MRGALADGAVVSFVQAAQKAYLAETKQIAFGRAINWLQQSDIAPVDRSHVSEPGEMDLPFFWSLQKECTSSSSSTLIDTITNGLVSLRRTVLVINIHIALPASLLTPLDSIAESEQRI